MRMSKSMVKFNWDADPSMTLRLLEIIESKDKYRQAFFPKSITRINGVYIIHAEACIDFFEEDDWIKDAKERGLVVRNRDWKRGGGKWKRVEENWTSGITNPLTTRVLLLIKKLKNGSYERDFGINPKWTNWNDIPTQEERERFRESHPYYFLLRKLVHPPVAQSTAVPSPSSSPSSPSSPARAATSSTGRSLRRRRSSTSSASSFSPTRSKFRSPSSSPAPVKAKRQRRIELSVIDDDIDARHSSDEEQEEKKKDRTRQTPATVRDAVVDSSWRAQGMLPQDEEESDSESNSDRLMSWDGTSTESKPDIESPSRADDQPTRVDSTQRAQSVIPLSVSESARVEPPSRPATSVIKGVRVGGGGPSVGPTRTADDAIEVDDASSQIEDGTKDGPDNHDGDPDIEQETAPLEPLQIGIAHNPLDAIDDTPYTGTDDCVLDCKLLRRMPTLKLIQMINNRGTKKEYPFSTGWSQPADEQKAPALSEVLLETLSRMHTDCPLQIKSALGYQLLVDTNYLSKGFCKGVIKLAVALGYEIDLLSSSRSRYNRLYANRQQKRVRKGWDSRQFLQVTWDSAMRCMRSSIKQLGCRIAQTETARRLTIQICVQKGVIFPHRKKLLKMLRTNSVLKSCEDNHDSQKGSSKQCRIHVTMDAIRGGLESTAPSSKGAAQCMSPARSVMCINEYLDRLQQE